MSLKALAERLAGAQHIGLTDFLRGKLEVVDPDATRGRLLAQGGGDHHHLAVELLGCYVVDDTDFFGDGEIYWWSIPVLVHADKSISYQPLNGLPNGSAPHKCGDHEWMTNISLESPPVWAVIPPDDSVAACRIRVGVYDDDKEPADLPAAMGEGLQRIVDLTEKGGIGGSADGFLSTVRDAIFESLKAQDDDILVEQDVTLRRGQVVRFGRGMVGSCVNAMARLYYVVRDVEQTEVFGPVSLRKGQVEKVRFESPIKRGGRLALFSRGASVECPSFGELDVDMPFTNRVVREGQEREFEHGISLVASGNAKVIAYYTPPSA